MSADRCRMIIERVIPPPPPTGDFFMVAVNGATYKSADDRADYGISKFLSMTRADDFNLQAGNNGIFVGFHLYQFTDHNGNTMNGYPVFIRDNDPGNVIYNFSNNGSRLTVNRTPIGGGTRAAYLDGWLDATVRDWSVYTGTGGRLTSVTDGNNLLFGLPQPTGSQKPYIRRSLDGSMGRVLTDGETPAAPLVFSDYQIRSLKEIMIDPYGHMYSRASSNSYYGYNFSDTDYARLSRAVNSNWPLQWMCFTPEFKGWLQYTMFYTGSSAGGAISNNAGAIPTNAGFAASYKSSSGPGGGGDPDSYWPIVNYRGETFAVYQYGSQAGDYDACGRVVFYKVNDGGSLTGLFSHPFDPALGGPGIPNVWTTPDWHNPIVLADNTICFIGRGGYGNPKSILYGDPNDGFMTYSTTMDIDAAPFSGLLDPNASFTHKIQRCRRFNLPF